MRILVLDDCPNVRKITTSFLRNLGHECLAHNDSRLVFKKLMTQDFDVILLDLHLASVHADGMRLIPRFLELGRNLRVVAISADSSVAVGAIRAGATDCLRKPLSSDLLEECLRKLELGHPCGGNPREPEVTFSSHHPEVYFGTKDLGMQAVLRLAMRAASAPTNLLILGESGTGKTMLARAIHAQSREREGPFVTVNCPSLSRELFESDLFGHTRGSFTGAIRDKQGKVALAHGGTLFLDEIGDLPLDIQPKLLRLIQEREYERVGDPKSFSADVRVIAATNKNLEDEMRAGQFREDLFYRLSVVPIKMLALRERIVDLPNLAEKQLLYLSRQMGKSINMGFSEEAMQAMRHYSWPGNLRELRNAIEHALIMVSGTEIGLQHFPAYLRDCESDDCQVGSLVSIDALERAHIERILNATTSKEEAAMVLGIDPTTLYRKRKRYSLAEPEMGAIA